MKILVEYFKEIEKLFDWYFHLTPIQRIQLNHIVILIFLAFLTYKNDEQHRKNNFVLRAGIDATNNARSREQKEYIENLKYFTEKYSNLYEKLLRQREEMQQIKEKK